MHNTCININGIMAIYHTADNDRLRLIERPIYGSSRFGIVKQNMTFLNGGILFKRDTFSVGLKNYEINDHLGNVTVTFLDRKYGNFPYITSSSDYYPFGFPMPDRGENLAMYRFGFNGQEADNEVYGDKASYAFEFRNYDARLGRWWGIDPMWQKYPSLSPYTYCANNPLILTDQNGADWDPEVNETTMTITIRATYYTTNEDKDKAQEGADLWNAQSGKYSYTTGEGDNQKTYTVNFELKVVSFETARERDEAFHRDGESNIFQIDNGLVPKGKRGIASDGFNIMVRSDASSRTFAHEMGHTLGLDDTQGTGGHDDGMNLMQSGGTGSIIMASYIRGILNASGITTMGKAAPTSPEAQPKNTYNMTGTLNRNKTK
jgi:RHS repeat-associated protein